MIHLNIGSNLNSKYGSRFDNISIAINLLIDLKIRIEKIWNFYETPSYPNQKLPKFLNVGIIVSYNNSYLDLINEIKKIEKKLGRIKSAKNDPRTIVDYQNTFQMWLLCHVIDAFREDVAA